MAMMPPNYPLASGLMQTMTSTISTAVQWYSTGTGSTTIANNFYNPQQQVVPVYKEIETPAPVKLLAGRTYKMPDGSKVILDHQGGFRVDDAKARVIYQANRVREFNPFLNASDLLDEYITELAPLGVRQDQVLNLAIEHFICWLVHKAAERDCDAPPKDVPKLPPPEAFRIERRCRSCGRFIRAAYLKAQIYFCTPAHMQKKLEML